MRYWKNWGIDAATPSSYLKNSIVLLMPLCATLSCGGSSDSGGGGSNPTLPFIPRFMDRWKGIDDNFQLFEYEFNTASEGSASGTFSPDDSLVTVRDTTNQIIASFNIQGSFEERDFQFDTLEGGNVVASFSGRFLEPEIMRVTPNADPTSAYQVYLTDDSTFIPDIEDTWQNTSWTLTLEYNVPFTNSDVAAFFNGTLVIDNGAPVSVDGYYISSVLLLRYFDAQGAVVEVAGNVSAQQIVLDNGQTLPRT